MRRRPKDDKVSIFMRRFTLKLFVIVLLSSLCGAKTYGAGIEVETTVQRVLDDGSFETLAFPSQDPLPPVEKASDPIQTAVSPALEVQAGSEMPDDLLGPVPEQNPAAIASDRGVPEQTRETANVAPLPALNRVAVGELLRYELRLHNANRFAVPAYGLELIEQLPPGVTFVGLSAGQGDWAVQPSAPAEVLDAKASDARQPSLRLRNTQRLPAGAHSFFSYDVVVQAPSNAELRSDGMRPEIDGVRVLDDSNAQLQRQD
jgi:hypothetical protein